MMQLLERADILLEQERYSEASDVLINLLAEYPNSDDLHFKVSLASMGLNQNERALEHINIAIGLDPEESYYYYIKASVLIEMDEYNEAEENLKTSIEINPHFSQAFAYWASIKLERKQFNEALELANESLRLDSSHILGLNMRSKALLKLKDLDLAKETIEDALKHDPNNAYTHSNFGWNLLEEAKPREAIIHFKEALAINPNDSYAQSGMIEALKAKSFIYRQFLKFTFWLGNRGSMFQWGFIIAYFVLNRIIANLIVTQPELAFVLKPVLYVIIGLALFTWFVAPISDLILRLNKYGRYLLSAEQVANSNLVGGLFTVSILSFTTQFIVDMNGFITLGIMALGLAIPYGRWFGEKVLLLKRITIGLTGLGIVAVFSGFNANIAFNQFGLFFVYGLLGYQIVMNKYHIDLDNK